MEKYAQGDDVRITVIDTDAQVEDSITNCMGFHDSPRNYPGLKNAETLVDLRYHLAAREAQIALYSIGARNGARNHEACNQMQLLRRAVQLVGRDLATPRGLDDAIFHLIEIDSKPDDMGYAA